MVTNKIKMVEMLNDLIQNLFEERNLMMQYLLKKEIDKVALRRPFEKRKIALVLEQIAVMRQHKISFKILVSSNLLRSSDSVLITNFQDYKYLISNVAIPDMIAFGEKIAEAHRTTMDCATWLVIHCIRKGQPLPRFVEVEHILGGSVSQFLDQFNQRDLLKNNI